MNLLILERVKDYCNNLLVNGRCKDLPFHNLHHTEKVVENVTVLSEMAELSPSKKEILIIAAYFHDVGYNVCYEGHEDESAETAIRFLKGITYPKKLIKEVEKVIISTKSTVKPTNMLSKIIKDADLSHLGNQQFLSINNRLRIEWECCLQLEFTNQNWLQMNLEFLESHEFCTPYAKSLYDAQKTKNIKTFKEMQFALANEIF